MTPPPAPESPTPDPPIVVVGAGLSGLAAARVLTRAGRPVVVLDKGRSVGGRLATRRLAGARLDHGAQFFTQRGPDLAALVRELDAAGLLAVWNRGFDGDDGHARYVSVEGMNALAKHLAADLPDVRVGHRVTAVRGDGSGPWTLEVETEDGATTVAAAAVLLTAPVPQSLELIDAGGVHLDPGIRPGLETLDYDAALAVLAVLDGPPALPRSGGIQFPDGPQGTFTFVADNATKLGGPHALTLHCSDRFTRRHWDDDEPALLDRLLGLAAPFLGDAGVVDAQLKKWRYAAPRRTWPDPCCVAVDGTRPLVLAGDAFDGPKVEGAWVSGLAAGIALQRTA